MGQAHDDGQLRVPERYRIWLNIIGVRDSLVIGRLGGSDGPDTLAATLLEYENAFPNVLLSEQQREHLNTARTQSTLSPIHYSIIFFLYIYIFLTG